MFAGSRIVPGVREQLPRRRSVLFVERGLLPHSIINFDFDGFQRREVRQGKSHDLGRITRLGHARDDGFELNGPDRVLDPFRFVAILPRFLLVTIVVFVLVMKIAVFPLMLIVVLLLIFVEVAFFTKVFRMDQNDVSRK